MTTGASLTKQQLLARVHRYIARCNYQTVVNASWLNDLMKHGLVPTGVRVENRGKHPQYTYYARAYRRALQIVRLRERGIVGQDAIRIILFLNGYSLPAWDVREALVREWPKHVKSVLAHVRSGYLNNQRPIPASHRSSLIKKLGPLDDRLEAGGFALPSDQMIEGLRLSLQEPVRLESIDIFDMARHMGIDNQSFQQLSGSITPVLSGLLMSDPAADALDGQLDFLESVIINSTDAQLDIARELARWSQKDITNPLRALGILSDESSADLIDLAVHSSVQRSAAWACVMIIIALMFARYFPDGFRMKDLKELRNRALSGEIDLSQAGPLGKGILGVFAQLKI